MSRGQLTYYFPAKEDILLAVFDRLLQLMHERVGRPRRRAPVRTPAARLGVAAALADDRRCCSRRACPEFHALAVHLPVADRPPRGFPRAAGEAVRGVARRTWRADLAGDLASRRGAAVSPRTFATLVQALLHGLAMQRAADPDAYDRAGNARPVPRHAGQLPAHPRHGTQAATRTAAPTPTSAADGADAQDPSETTNNVGERSRRARRQRAAASATASARCACRQRRRGRAPADGRAPALGPVRHPAAAPRRPSATGPTASAPAGRRLGHEPPADDDAPPLRDRPPRRWRRSGDVVLEAKGYIIPVHQIQVSPKVGGMIVWLDRDFEEGQCFKKGELAGPAGRRSITRPTATTPRPPCDAAEQRCEELDSGYRPEEIEQAKARAGRSRGQAASSCISSWTATSSLSGTMPLPPARVRAGQVRLRRHGPPRRATCEAGLRLMEEGPRNEKIEAAEADVEAGRGRPRQGPVAAGQLHDPRPDHRHHPDQEGREGQHRQPVGLQRSAGQPVRHGRPVRPGGRPGHPGARHRQGRQGPELPRHARGVPERRAVPAEAPQGYEGDVSRLMPIADRAKGAVPVRVKVDDAATTRRASTSSRTWACIVSFLKRQVKRLVDVADRANAMRRRRDDVACAEADRPRRRPAQVLPPRQRADRRAQRPEPGRAARASSSP